MNNLISLINERLSLVDLIGSYVKLTLKSNSEYTGLCPFHKEKTPSFFVNNEKNVYNCFGCGAQGNIVNFLMEYERLEYKEAIKKLANLAGLDSNLIQKQQNKTDEKEVFYKIYSKTCSYYKTKLFSQEGKRALRYIKNRNISDKTIDLYNLGYAPSNHQELLKYLLEEFSEKNIIESGVLVKKNGKIYSMFFDRLLFPIYNERNNCIAFGGRALGDQSPKYLNSSENPIFHKSNHLYGFNISKRDIIKSNECILVEGYMDVISLASEGIKNVVAPLGTSVNIEQIKKLWKLVHDPIICFDNDEAGKKASLRIAAEALEHISHNQSLKFTILNKGKDPDEIIKKLGKEAFMSFLNNSLPLSDFLFQHQINTVNLTPEGKVLLLKNLENITLKINNVEIRKNYLFHFKKLYFNFLKSLSNSKGTYNNLDALITTTSTSRVNENLIILTILSKYPDFLKENDVMDELVSLELSNQLDMLRGMILDSFLESQHICLENIKKSVSSKHVLGGNFLRAMEDILKIGFLDSKEQSKNIILKLFKNHKLGTVKREIEQIKKSLLENDSKSLMEKMLYLKRCEKQLTQEISSNF